MKRITNSLSFMLILVMVAVSVQSCKDSKTKSSTDKKADFTQTDQDTNIKVYYFHATRRCATCQAVEATTKEALQKYYGTKIPFQSINREENEENPMIEKYKINGQTLLIIKGDKVVNLTNEAFMNARTSPDKFKAKLKLTIDSMIE